MPRIVSKNRTKMVVEKIDWKSMTDLELCEYATNHVARVWGDIPDRYRIYDRGVTLYMEALCEGTPVYEVVGASDGQVVIRQIYGTERDVFNWNKL